MRKIMKSAASDDRLFVALMVTALIGIVAPICVTFAQSQPMADVQKPLDVQVAQAWLNLAQSRLDTARSHRRPPYFTVIYEQAVKSFAQSLDEAEQGSPPDSFEALLRDMDHLSNIAEQRLRQAESINEQLSGTINESQLQLLNAKHTILSLGAKKGHALRDGSRDAQVEWQLDQLRSLSLILADRLFDEGL